MVKANRKAGNVLYVCDACGFAYKEESWAQKCEAWCSKHSSCNIEITKHAVH
ncbi:MAG: hypothetical protein HYX24_01770 [Candidatus Aenigmarchaeota archaeon]|nr:hypothetical protein [Candidatus Aenigmarchaeota archaeon]